MTNLSETVNTLQLSAKAYKLAGRIAYAGLPVSVETRKGQKRSGTGADGKPWIVTMPWDYGYINLPKTQGQDGQKVDCFIGPDKKAQYVYIIHQGKEANVDKYDEDKVMLGFSSADAALKAYKSAYVGVDLYQGMSVMSLDAFKKKLLSTRTKKKNFKLHADFGGFFPDDYYQFTEKTGMQPLPSKHPPSLKKPIDVPSDNPDDKEDKYKDRKKRRSKRTLRDTKEFTRHQTGKPEIAETTTFVPIDQG